MKMLFSFILLFLTSGIALAQAMPSVNASAFFRESASKLPREIMKTCGLQKVGGLDLPTLLESAQSLNWRALPVDQGLITDAQGKNRVWAVYDAPSSTVYVNEATLNNVAQSRQRSALLPLMALHETLRHFQVEDENYAATLSLLWADSTCQADHIESKLGVDLKRMGRGGVTSTGGGGNDMALWVKVHLILAMIPAAEKNWPAWVAAHPRLQNFSKEQVVKALIDASLETSMSVQLGTQTETQIKNGKLTYILPSLIFEMADEDKMFEALHQFLDALLVNL